MIKSKWSKFDNQIESYIKDSDLSNSEIAQTLLNTKESARKNKNVDKLRTYVSRFRNRGITEASNNLQVDTTNVKHLWLKDKNSSLFVKNPDYKEPSKKEIEEIDFASLFKDKIKPLEVSCKEIKESALFDLLTITDVHIGMNPNPDGFSLYGGVWNEEEVFKRQSELVNHLLSNQKSSVLYIDDLGDYMDGWDGETVRKGHELPQNMDNQKAFDVGFAFKVNLLETLASHYKEITLTNICDDNHSGAFGYVVNQAVKSYCDIRFKHVKVINQRKFIDHYKRANRTFILTHGKDGKNLKFGFKPFLDPAQVEKINNYLDEHYLKQPDTKIYFCKGDSHQDIIDKTTAQNFEYWNFPAFSPSSNWVQTNFKKGASGFYVVNYFETTESINPYYFKWKN